MTNGSKKRTDEGNRSTPRQKMRAVKVRIERSGFTLLEILIVVVIIAIAAMIAVPLATSAASVQARSAANMIAADLEYAKSMAISRGQSFSVAFDAGGDCYRILDQNGDVISHPVKKGFDYLIDFTSDGRLDRVDISNVDFNSAGSVTFDCLGSPDNGGVVTVQAGGATLMVVVEPVTGFITIQD